MFYVQHGFGKSSKIDDCVARGEIGGVILSPAHEDVATLAATVNSCQRLGLRVLLDPQSYVYATTPPGQMRFHDRHGLDFSAMHWAMSPSELVAAVDAVGEANDAARVAPPWICPAPFNRSLTDYWMPSGIQFIRTALERWSGEGVIATLAFDESVLADWDRVSEWLDVLTTLDVAGYYMVVSRRAPVYPPVAWDPSALANLMRMVHVLAEVNEYEVIWGYADVDGLLGIAAGASAVASGWSYGLRQFNIERYSEKRGGGAPAVPRVYLPSLLSDIRFNEAEDIFRSAPGGEELFPHALRKTYASRSFASLGNPEAQTQHLADLSIDVSSIAQFSDLEDRLDALSERIETAVLNFSQLAASGLSLEPRYLGRLVAYREAIRLFRDGVIL